MADMINRPSSDPQAYNDFIAKQATKVLLAQRCGNRSPGTTSKLRPALMIIFSQWAPLETPSGFAILSADLEAHVLAAKWVFALRDLVQSGISREQAEKRLRALLSHRVATTPTPPRSTWRDRWHQTIPDDLKRLLQEVAPPAQRE